MEHPKAFLSEGSGMSLECTAKYVHYEQKRIHPVGFKVFKAKYLGRSFVRDCYFLNCSIAIPGKSQKLLISRHAQGPPDTETFCS